VTGCLRRVAALPAFLATRQRSPSPRGTAFLCAKAGIVCGCPSRVAATGAAAAGGRGWRGDVQARLAARTNANIAVSGVRGGTWERAGETL